jgi:hypothetical protein
MTDEQLAELGQHPSVRQVEVHAPALEEIFVAYMQLGESDVTGAGTDTSGAGIEEGSAP